MLDKYNMSRTPRKKFQATLDESTFEKLKKIRSHFNSMNLVYLPDTVIFNFMIEFTYNGLINEKMQKQINAV